MLLQCCFDGAIEEVWWSRESIMCRVPTAVHHFAVGQSVQVSIGHGLSACAACQAAADFHFK
jgi:hypothetical protein